MTWPISLVITVFRTRSLDRTRRMLPRYATVPGCAGTWGPLEGVYVTLAAVHSRLWDGWRCVPRTSCHHRENESVA